MEPRLKKLLDQVRDAPRLKHDSIRTENSYMDWIQRYILFHSRRYRGTRRSLKRGIGSVRGR